MKKQNYIFLFGISLFIFSILYISAIESDWINGFNSQTGEVRDGGDIPLNYFGEIKCEHDPCSFTVAGTSMGFDDKTSEEEINNIPAVLSSNLSCSENYTTWRTASVQCSNCTFSPGDYNNNNNNWISDIVGVESYVGFGSFVGAVENAEETISVITCTDSDNGSDIFNKGTVSFVDESGQSYEKEDYCKKDSFTLNIMEYSCEGNTLLNGKSYPCLDSNCIDGACKKSVTCTDSDGGNNYFTKGTVTAEYSDGSIIENTDLCVWGALQEFYCEGGSIKLSSHICSDSICSDGACRYC